MEPWSGFVMIGRLRLGMQFGPTTFGGCQHWDSLEVAGLKELIGPAAQMIWVSPVVEILVITGPESDLWAHYGPVLG